MKTQQEKEYLEAVTRILTLFASALANPKPLTETLVSVWVLVISREGVPAGDLQSVAARICADQTYFPAPADFLKAWRPVEDGDTAAERAWTQVLQAIRTAGRWGSLSVSQDFGGDRAALWALKEVGWERLCDQMEEDEKSRLTFRAEFIRCYKVARQQKAGLSYLVGECERLNRGRFEGQEMDVPMLCGRSDWKALPPERTKAGTPALPAQMALPSGDDAFDDTTDDEVPEWLKENPTFFRWMNRGMPEEAPSR